MTKIGHRKKGIFWEFVPLRGGRGIRVFAFPKPYFNCAAQLMAKKTVKSGGYSRMRERGSFFGKNLLNLLDFDPIFQIIMKFRPHPQYPLPCFFSPTISQFQDNEHIIFSSDSHFPQKKSNIMISQLIVIPSVY